MFKWQIYSDMKVIAMLQGIQGGFTKYCCFLCLWDIRATKHRYVRKFWAKRASFKPGTANVENMPLVDPQKVLLPPLHIKLCLMKKFVRAMDKNGDGFQFLLRS